MTGIDDDCWDAPASPPTAGEEADTLAGLWPDSETTAIASEPVARLGGSIVDMVAKVTGSTWLINGGSEEDSLPTVSIFVSVEPEGELKAGSKAGVAVV